MSRIFGMCLLLAATASAQAPTPDNTGDTRLTAVSGEVDVKFKGDTEWTPAETDTPLEVGDEVKTGPGSRAELGYGGQSVYELQEDSALTVAELSAMKTALDLSVGTLLAHIKKVVVGSSVELRTKAAVATVVGTELGVNATADGITGVGVFDGNVIVEGRGVPGVPGKQFKLKTNDELRLKFGIHPEDPKPLKAFAPFKPRLKAMSGRRIELRRDWRALTAEERAEKRKQMADTRLKRRDARAKTLPGSAVKGAKPKKAAAKGAAKKRKGKGKKR